ncbi:MAG: hypothetical protein WB788_00210, partial [Thermoplasmata archaeon]
MSPPSNVADETESAPSDGLDSTGRSALGSLVVSARPEVRVGSRARDVSELPVSLPGASTSFAT